MPASNVAVELASKSTKRASLNHWIESAAWAGGCLDFAAKLLLVLVDLCIRPRAPPPPWPCIATTPPTTSPSSPTKHTWFWGRATTKPTSAKPTAEPQDVEQGGVGQRGVASASTRHAPLRRNS